MRYASTRNPLHRVGFSESVFQFRVRMSKHIHNRFLADLMLALYRKFYILSALVRTAEAPDRQARIVRILRRFWAAMVENDVEAARAVVARLNGKDKLPAFLEQVRAFKVLHVEARQGEPIEVEIQVVTLGDTIAWVSLPGEIFVELGLALKQDSPFRQTIIAELANGSIGYVPARRA